MKRKVTFTIEQPLIESLGVSLYADRRVFSRELVANAIDAQATQMWLLEYGNGFVFADDGIGMNIDELEESMKRIGYSIKRMTGGAIGRYGVGRLSLLNVTDRWRYISWKPGEKPAYAEFDKYLFPDFYVGELSEEEARKFLPARRGTAVIVENYIKGVDFKTVLDSFKLYCSYIPEVIYVGRLYEDGRREEYMTLGGRSIEDFLKTLGTFKKINCPEIGAYVYVFTRPETVLKIFHYHMPLKAEYMEPKGGLAYEYGFVAVNYYRKDLIIDMNRGELAMEEKEKLMPLILSKCLPVVRKELLQKYLQGTISDTEKTALRNMLAIPKKSYWLHEELTNCPILPRLEGGRTSLNEIRREHERKRVPVYYSSQADINALRKLKEKGIEGIYIYYTDDIEQSFIEAINAIGIRTQLITKEIPPPYIPKNIVQVPPEVENALSEVLNVFIRFTRREISDFSPRIVFVAETRKPWKDYVLLIDFKVSPEDFSFTESPNFVININNPHFRKLKILRYPTAAPRLLALAFLLYEDFLKWYPYIENYSEANNWGELVEKTDSALLSTGGLTAFLEELEETISHLPEKIKAREELIKDLAEILVKPILEVERILLTAKHAEIRINLLFYSYAYDITIWNVGFHHLHFRAGEYEKFLRVADNVSKVFRVKLLRLDGEKVGSVLPWEVYLKCSAQVKRAIRTILDKIVKAVYKEKIRGEEEYKTSINPIVALASIPFFEKYEMGIDNVVLERRGEILEYAQVIIEFKDGETARILEDIIKTIMRIKRRYR